MISSSRRRFLRAGLALTNLVVLSGCGIPLPQAQQPAKVHRIGYLSLESRTSESARSEAFRQGLRDLGYIEGETIAVEYRYADGNTDRLADLAAELIGLNVDVLVAAGPAVAAAAGQATRSIPIVFPVHGDPVGSGLVASLARPGGNITGLTSLALQINGKRLELLKESVPSLSRAALVWNPTNPAHVSALNDSKLAATALGLQLEPLEVKTPDEFESAFSAINSMGLQALVLLASGAFNTRRAQIAARAIESRLPTIFYNSDWPQDGGLMSYGVDVPDMFRRSAIFVDKILKGAKPGDLPVEQPTKFELVINLKTANQIGLTIPPGVLARADRVIQ